MEILNLYKSILENSEERQNYHLDRLKNLYEMRGCISLELDLFYGNMDDSEISGLKKTKNVLNNIINLEEKELKRINAEAEYSREMIKEVVKYL